MKLFFTHRHREYFNCVLFSGSPSHCRGSSEATPHQGQPGLEFMQWHFFACDVHFGKFSFNSVMISFSSALLLFFVVVGFVMSADIIFL